MPRTKISEYSATAADNTDIDGINLGEGMFPSDVNNAIRELMSQIKELQAGTSGDTIPVAAGGTGATTLTSNNVLLGNGTSSVNFVAPGASGNVLTSNGTTWTSAAGGGGGSLLGNTDSDTPYETFLGYQAGNINTGLYNTFIGYLAGRLNTSGGSNVAVGFNALQGSATGSNNVAIGVSSMQVSNSANNVSIGYGSFLNLSTGASNTALGYFAGGGLATGSNNVIIGNNANASSNSVSNTVTLGNSSIDTLRCQVTTITALSDVRDKKDVKELNAGLDFVNELNPVFFTWDMRDGGKVNVLDTGFIAQELQATQVKTGITIPGLVNAENPDKLEAGYGKLLPVLVKAIKELNAKVDTQATEIAALKAQK